MPYTQRLTPQKKKRKAGPMLTKCEQSPEVNPQLHVELTTLAYSPSTQESEAYWSHSEIPCQPGP